MRREGAFRGVPEAADRDASLAWRPDTRARPRRRVRGANLLAELETLVVLGAGRFDVGVHLVANLFRAPGLVARCAEPAPLPFADRIDRRHWAASVYEEDAALLAGAGGGTSLVLSALLAQAWPRLAPYRERIEARLAELPEDGIARAWKAAGGAPWWSPPAVPTQQTHLVLADTSEAFHDGTPR